MWVKFQNYYGGEVHIRKSDIVGWSTNPYPLVGSDKPSTLIQCSSPNVYWLVKETPAEVLEVMKRVD